MVKDLATYFRVPVTRIIDDVAYLCEGSLVSQRDHGIALGGATRGDVASDKRDQRQNGRTSSKNNGVAWLYLKEQAGHCAREGQRPNNSDKDAGGSKFCCLGHNQSQNIAPLPAESHPYADLVRALAGGIGHNAINSDASQNRREGRKSSEQEHVEPLLRKRYGHPLFHCLHIAYGNLTVQAPNLCFHLFNKPGERTVCPDGQGHPSLPGLVGLWEGCINGRIGRLVQT